MPPIPVSECQACSGSRAGVHIAASGEGQEHQNSPPVPLQPYDHLLYFDNSIVDWGIALKTGKKYGHIEIYTGNGMSIASRNGIGVNAYPLRLGGLVAVLRPYVTYEPDKASKWFNEVARGQGYDFLGLACFYLAVKQGSANKQFCSEFARNWDREAGIESFHDDWPGDLVAPGDFLASPAFDHVWKT